MENAPRATFIHLLHYRYMKWGYFMEGGRTPPPLPNKKKSCTPAKILDLNVYDSVSLWLLEVWTTFQIEIKILSK